MLRAIAPIAFLRRVRASRRARFATLAAALPCIVLALAVALTPLPPGLKGGEYGLSVSYLDRDGVLLREVRADDATRARWVSLQDVGPRVTSAILAAEDRRFYEHHGVDVLAVGRAVLSSVWHHRVVSGASTLTMQLARLAHPMPRTALGKLAQMVVALRIEASLSKREILEQYINRAPFGPAIRGIDSASRLYFDKPPAQLSLAEAAALAAIPRGPGVYTMRVHPERVKRRRDRILDRMLGAATVTRESHDRAEAEPLVVWSARGTYGAPHLVQAIESGDVDPAEGGLGWAKAERVASVTTTLARGLQREAEFATESTIRSLSKRHVTAASVVVIDNESGEILAYVGSPSFDDAAHGGQNDGVRAKRQPGSTLKPFVYGLAMEKLGFTPATQLPDVELHLPVDNGVYAPNNYDEHFHGPVRLREALANSLNVPAVWTASHIGTDALVARLRELGFASLDQDPSAYGPGVALGDGEVTLLELTNAYAALARGGVWLPVRAVHSAKRAGGEEVSLLHAEGRRVMPEPVARVVADILQDDRARIASFGEQSALDLPFPVAAKTGTSKGFRDNWTVGFTRAVTVGVWVGNFDGSPMRDVSGITGAGPLFRAVMEAAMRDRPKEPLALDEGQADALGLVRAHVCPLSGGAATDACPHAISEWVPRNRPLEPCHTHEVVVLDRRNGLRAGPTCRPEVVETRVFEHFDAEYREWARDARRPVAPTEYSPLCPASSIAVRDAASELRIAYPRDGSHYILEPSRSTAQQTVPVRVLAPSASNAVRLYVDGRASGSVRAPFVAEWQLQPGEHVLVAEAEPGVTSAPIHITVE